MAQLLQTRKPISSTCQNAPASHDTAPEKLSNWKCVGRKPGGTAAGAIYTDRTGQKWLVKGYGDSDMAKSEVLASNLLNAVGAHTAEMKLVDLGDKHKGGFGVASRWLNKVQPLDASKMAHVKSMQQAFAAHAWLANWDSVGLAHDNTVIHKGNAIHLDPGGALEYRAMGGKKGGAFAGKVHELETMRNPAVNRASATVYGTMTNKEVADSAKVVLDLPASTITDLVARYGPGSAEHRAALTAKLIERQQDIRKWCQVAQPDHALEALDKMFPTYTGKLSGEHVKNLGKFIELGAVIEPLQPLEAQYMVTDTSIFANQTLVGVSKLSKLQLQAIADYSLNGYQSMNKSLREGRPTEVAKAFDAAIHAAGCEIPSGTILSRTLRNTESFKDQLLNATGKVLQEPGLMSTSVKPDGYTYGEVHMKLSVGHGVKGLFLGRGSAPGGGAISLMPNEEELVLPANTRLYIHSVMDAPSGRDKDGFGGFLGVRHIVHAVVLPTH